MRKRLQKASNIDELIQSAAKAGAKFSTAKVPGVRGRVVVDGRGHTVYIHWHAFTNVPCTEESGCTDLWPELVLPDGVSAATAGTGIDAEELGTKKSSDGETHPTYNDWLMYEYTGDSGPRQAEGLRIKSFGGTWYLLSPSGQLVNGKNGFGY